nr:MAG TPA: hypothetical protein [Caudoviricetes sp.]
MTAIAPEYARQKLSSYKQTNRKNKADIRQIWRK